MPWQQADADWFALGFLRSLKHDRTNRRLTSLLHQLEAGDMKIKITEPTFFLGADRKPGDVLNNVVVGPFRTEVQPGGLRKIAQFVELPSEIHVVTDQTTPASTPTVTVPPPVSPIDTPAKGSFAEATASVLKPAQPAPAATQPASTASKYSALATRRKKLHQFLQDGANAYEKRLTDMETQAPQVLTKANSLLDDEQNSMQDLEDSLTEFAGANGGPLQG